MNLDSIKRDLLQRKTCYSFTIFVLLILLPLSILAAVCFGTMRLPIREVYQVVRWELARIFLCQPIPEKWAPGTALHDVVWLIRLPRLVLAATVGAGLSISGAVMQAIVKNPLADPYILGISSGASLGATVAVTLGVGIALGPNYIGFMAFLGAFGAAIAVIALANAGGRTTPVKLLLAGAALSAVCGAFSNFIIYAAHNDHSTSRIVNWTMGSLAAATWENNAVILGMTLAGTLFFLTQRRTLNLMLLGDEGAVTLGTELHRWRIAYLVVSALMVGFAVYNAGVIGFVGLVIPHSARMLFGTDHKRLLPVSALGGGIFLVWADVLCRTVLPGNELPIGILTSVLGAPVFIYLMARKKYGFGGGER